jgi:DGQHR domain-containing protein
MKKLPVVVKCLPIEQPIGVFYVAVMKHNDLIDISYSDVRRLEDEQREIEEYIGIQRPLSLQRVKEIAKYVNLIDAAFPTGILLHISSEFISYREEGNELEIVRDSNVAKVLDGQHRIAGLENYNAGDVFELPVVIFVDMELEDQALIFATINQTQTKVNKSLAYDLFAFATHRSPQRTCHDIVRALNSKDTSPFYKKVKILGVANNSELETITQATFVESILKYITRDKMFDRDIYKKGGIPEKANSREITNLIFRNMFIDEKDLDIAKILRNYFSCVQKKWPEAWNSKARENILNKSTGFIALMRLLRDIINDNNVYEKVISEDTFCSYFDKVKMKSKDFNPQSYVPGSSGQADLYNALKSKMELR